MREELKKAYEMTATRLQANLAKNIMFTNAEGGYCQKAMNEISEIVNEWIEYDDETERYEEEDECFDPRDREPKSDIMSFLELRDDYCKLQEALRIGHYFNYLPSLVRDGNDRVAEYAVMFLTAVISNYEEVVKETACERNEAQSRFEYERKKYMELKRRNSEGEEKLKK